MEHASSSWIVENGSCIAYTSALATGDCNVVRSLTVVDRCHAASGQKRFRLNGTRDGMAAAQVAKGTEETARPDGRTVLLHVG